MPDETAATHGPERITIQIDRVHYEVDVTQMTGSSSANFRSRRSGRTATCSRWCPATPTARSGTDEEVELRNGTRFFTAPAHINPGRAGR